MIRRLPRGLCGVVLRDAADARAIAQACRARRLALSVAGDWRLAAALHAGLHLRGGRRPPGAPAWLRALTSSAHDVADLHRARRAGVELAFFSPVFATQSHPRTAPHGPLRFGLAARAVGGAAALGGIDGKRARRLPLGLCRAIGAIGAWQLRHSVSGMPP